MGAQIQKPEALNLDQYCPPLQEYKFKHFGPNFCVWNNQLKNQSLIQFPIIIPNQNILRQQIQMYLFRNRHHLLVSSMFFKRNKQTNSGSIFYQRVFTNLSRIKDIPFGDTLQFYYVAFKGFQLLFKKFGYFYIQENMFHITQNKKIKVWCHKDIFKLRPNASNNKTKISQQQMVKRIIEIISQNSDSANNCINIGQIIYEQASFSFSSALHKLREIFQREGFIISQKLNCLDIISQGEVGNILDQYGPNKQKEYQNQQQQSKNVLESLKLNLQRFAIKDQSNCIVKQAKQKNYNNTAQISQKIEYVQNSMANTRTKKQKGLQVSHSLQKLKQIDSNINNLNQFSTLNIKNSRYHIQIQSPIKNIQANKFSQFKQLRSYAPISMHQQPQKIQNVRFVAPQNYVQNLQVLNHPPPHLMRNPLCQPPLFNKSHQIIRQNSVDNFKRQQMPKNIGQDQFKVVINLVNRPSTSNNNKNRFLSNIIPPVKKNEQPKFLKPINPFLQPFIHSNHRNLQFLPPNSSHQRIQNLQLTHKTQDCNLQFKKQVNYKTNLLQNQNIQFKLFTNGINLRETIITGLSQFQAKQQNKPFRDTTNFKQRFEAYKKNFIYNKFDNEFTYENNNFAPNGNNIQNNYKQNIRKLNLKRPFFSDHLHADTVNPYIDQNAFFAQKKSQIEKNIQPTNKIQKSTINQFPTVTDVSENLSYLPNKQKNSGNEQNIWKQQSIVVKHDINTSNIQMPMSKKYTTNIDQDIWADLQRIKIKYKIPTTQL